MDDHMKRRLTKTGSILSARSGFLKSISVGLSETARPSRR